VWSEATFLSSTVRGEAQGPPSRARQAQNELDRKNALKRFGAKRQKQTKRPSGNQTAFSFKGE
jgi:hypothetical protein